MNLWFSEHPHNSKKLNFYKKSPKSIEDTRISNQKKKQKKVIFFFSKKERLTCNKGKETVFVSKNLKILCQNVREAKPSKESWEILRSQMSFFEPLMAKSLTLNSNNGRRKKWKGLVKSRMWKDQIGVNEIWERVKALFFLFFFGAQTFSL